MNHYLNETELLSAMNNLAAAFPQDCDLLMLPHATHEGRTVRALRIGRKVTPPSVFNHKVGVLFTGSAHAREWGGADILIYLASDLLKAYSAGQGLKYEVAGRGPGVTFSAAQLQQMRNHVDLFLVPCVNPDGRAYSMSSDTASLWRKNRNPASSGGLAWKVGVDINRNFDFLWDFRQALDPQVPAASLRVSDDPASETFHGIAPNSEPETRNVVHLFASQPQIAHYIDVHSYTGDVLYPWGNAPNQSVDPAQNFLNPAYDGRRGVDNLAIYGEYIGDDEQATLIALSQRISETIQKVTGETYAVTQSYDLAPGTAGGSPGQAYVTTGTADDYATARGRAVPGASDVLGLTLEFHKDGGTNSDFAFHPPFPKMAEIIAEVDAGLIAYCLDVERRSRTVVRVPGIRAEILFGVTSGGGGIVLINGVLKRIPPRSPLIPSLAAAVGIYADAESLPPERRREARLAALRAMNDAVSKAATMEG